VSWRLRDCWIARGTAAAGDAQHPLPGRVAGVPDRGQVRDDAGQHAERRPDRPEVRVGPGGHPDRHQQADDRQIAGDVRAGDPAGPGPGAQVHRGEPAAGLRQVRGQRRQLDQVSGGVDGGQPLVDLVQGEQALAGGPAQDRRDPLPVGVGGADAGRLLRHDFLLELLAFVQINSIYHRTWCQPPRRDQRNSRPQVSGPVR
jgi:hypothetical protein